MEKNENSVKWNEVTNLMYQTIFELRREEKFCVDGSAWVVFILHGGGRARHSDWYENSFVMVVYEKISLVVP